MATFPFLPLAHDIGDAPEAVQIVRGIKLTRFVIRHPCAGDDFFENRAQFGRKELGGSCGGSCAVSYARVPCASGHSGTRPAQGLAKLIAGCAPGFSLRIVFALALAPRPGTIRPLLHEPRSASPGRFRRPMPRRRISLGWSGSKRATRMPCETADRGAPAPDHRHGGENARATNATPKTSRSRSSSACGKAPHVTSRPPNSRRGFSRSHAISSSMNCAGASGIPRIRSMPRTRTTARFKRPTRARKRRTPPCSMRKCSPRFKRPSTPARDPAHGDLPPLR